MKMYAGAFLTVLAGCGEGERAPAPPAATAAAETPADRPIMGEERRIVAFGDSLFAGYGLGEGEGYPERLEAALRARGINARVRNAGVSGDTAGAGRQRLAFVLDSQPGKPDLVVVSLGGNDMLRGLPPRETRASLDAMLDELDRRGIKAVLMGMLAPPNLGAKYRREFDSIYPALAREHDAALVPFFLQGVVGKPDLIQADRIHPTKQGIEEMVASTVETVAEALPD